MQEKGETGSSTAYAVDLKRKIIDDCNSISGEEFQNIYKNISKKPGVKQNP